jgi:hypothetical protein
VITFSARAFADDPAAMTEALAWLHALPKLGGMVNKGLEPDRFQKLTLNELKTLKEMQIGGHAYLENGKLGPHLKLPENDYHHLIALPALETLKFPENDLGDEALVHIGKIKTLRSLQLMENKITNDGLKHLAGLKELKHLDLSWNQQLDDLCVSHLTQLTQLQELNLFQTKISADGVKRIEIALPHCKVITTKP